MKVNCPHCDQKYDLDESLVGEELQCQACDGAMLFEQPEPANIELKFYCPHCDQRYQLVESQLGVEQKCQACQGSMLFHAPEGYIFQTPAQPSSSGKTKTSSSNRLALVSVILLLVAGVGFYGYKKWNTEEVPQEQTSTDELPADEADSTQDETTSPPVTPEPVVGNPLTKQPVENKPIEADPEPAKVTVTERKPEPPRVKNNAPLYLVTAFEKKAVPFFQQHCVSCHGPDKEKGSLRVDRLVANLDDLYTLDHLQNIIDEMTVENMPPEDEPRPDSKEIVEIIKILAGLEKAAKEKHSTGGGRPVRRLTRTEFINTMWDQLGVRIDEDGLPDDLQVGTFETNADNLFLTDMHVRLYLDKSRDIVRRFIQSRDRKPGYQKIPVKYSPALMDSELVFDASDVPPAGHLLVRSHWWLRDASNDSPVIIGPADNSDQYAVRGTRKAPQKIDFKLWQADDKIPWLVKKSEIRSKNLNAGLTKREGKQRLAALGEYELNDRTLIKAQERKFIHPVVLGKIEYWQKVSSQPYDFFAPFLKNGDRLPDSVAPVIIRKFASLVKRGRPVDSAFVEKLNVVFKQGRQQGMPFWQAIEEPLAIAICSMDSMLHFEDRDPSKTERTVSGVELANRLAYTLWRSAPDATLVNLGRSGDLLDQKIKAQQVKRMMEDPKFDRFIHDFTDQWFELPRQDEIAVDERVYRDFDTTIKPAMKEETVQFMSYVLRRNLPITNLIDSDFMVLNDVMARHYGISGVEGNKFRAVKRTGTAADQVRGGILTHAGILMQGGTGDRTSIVERGAFIARKLIDKPPGDPPPDAGELPTTGEDIAKLTAVELVNLHAKLPQCATCHAGIDPLGMGLENYDAVGLYRTKETRLNPLFDQLSKRDRRNPNKHVIKVPLDTQGFLYDGQKFSGVSEMKRVLMTKKHDLAKGYIKALLSYTNGREASFVDEAIVEKIAAQAASRNYPARTIIEQIIFSEVMTKY